MSFEAQCPQCMFVSRQLMQPTPCLLHVSPDFQSEQLVASKPVANTQDEYDEPYEFGQLRLTVDRLGPFSLREYVRLRLLRSRLEAEPSLQDAPTLPTQVGSLSRK
ncbi:MAG TPA: hypothetical protein VKV73_09265 [Chloroflexota bacterium]|nr:hypothetical protein [Chloroflexota bacterium]